ncbi:hypothetical protein BC936DRAFT_150008 [Jimgerdemannia flammicorona]|uniref:Uncharacterized protein n=1 Tax=Jimgerdemannia flammicorona TaxID=994334 RepID=A0A433CZP1_9FUNG|nr:hypothetical protein BC936DRAFT_150008 [Jimgerdemannia flammicorona]
MEMVDIPLIDIFIDDNPVIIEKTRDFFPDKCLILSDNAVNRYIKVPNIYHLKTTVSDLKNEDFIQNEKPKKYKNKQRLLDTINK